MEWIDYLFGTHHTQVLPEFCNVSTGKEHPK
jgi:hypothetical protein